jgi:hypothetical protein
MTDTKVRRVFVFVLVVFLISGVSPSVIAAGNTDVKLSPESNTITTGSTTTVDIVVMNATGGVGAVNVTVSLSSGDAATITDASLDDTAYSVKKQTNTDNTSVTIIGFGLDTSDSGSVVVGDLTVRGDTSETTEILLQVNGLGDESGSDYTIDSVDGTSVSVTSSSEGGDGSGDDETPTPTTEEPNTSTTTEEPNTSTTTEKSNTSTTTTAQTSGSQAPGFGLLVTVLTFTGTVVLLFIRISNGVRSEHR